MNLPVGEVITRGVNLNEIDIRRLLEGFYDKNFSGYLVVSLEGFDGIEEGLLLFKGGSIVAAFYEYDLYGITVFGDSAIKHVFNSFAAEYVVGDVISLSNQQVDLVTAFNDKSKVSESIPKNQVAKLIPKIFSHELAKGVLSEIVKESESKKDIFKKLGLSKLGQ